MQRRTLLQAALALPTLLLIPASSAATRTNRMLEDIQSKWREFLPAGAEVPTADDKVKLSDSAWREQLGAAEYDVLRKEGTERPFTSPLNNEKRDGVFLCRGCDLPVFTSEMKFDSGTGWPSFFTSIPGAFETSRDFKLVWPRTEYHCARCGGHHGHVFNDGPQPTGERWCNNGVALKFVAKEGAA